MRLATSSSCSTRSRSRVCCSISSRNGVTMFALHSSTILPPETRSMTISGVAHALPVGATPNNVPRSVVDGAHCKATYHNVAVGCLELDDVADVGEGGVLLGGTLYITLAARDLAGKQAVIDEVGSHHLLQR